MCCISLLDFDWSTTLTQHLTICLETLDKYLVWSNNRIASYVWCRKTGQLELYDRNRIRSFFRCSNHINNLFTFEINKKTITDNGGFFIFFSFYQHNKKTCLPLKLKFLNLGSKDTFFIALLVFFLLLLGWARYYLVFW